MTCTRSVIFAGLAAIAAATAGCSRIDEPATQTPVPTTGTGTPAPTAPDAVPDQPSRSGADLGVAQSADHGEYLVDATGKSLYLLEKDTAGASLCYEACSSQWPPLLAMQGTPQGLDPAVKAGSIGTLQRTDGTMQVTYNGHPLYHYAKDVAAGQLNGQGMEDQFGEWYLVSPTGEPVDDH